MYFENLLNIAERGVSYLTGHLYVGLELRNGLSNWPCVRVGFKLLLPFAKASLYDVTRITDRRAGVLSQQG